MQDLLLRNVLPYAVPLQRGLASDVKSGDLLFEQDQARVKRQLLTRLAVDPACQALEPTGTGVVNREIGRDPHPGELRGGGGGTPRQDGTRSSFASLMLLTPHWVRMGA
jgi:hypothetical protein